MYKSNINLNLYKTFYEVAKLGNISETAKSSFSSQPAISRSIKKLEEELGTKLFFRKANGVELTSKGKELLHFVEVSYNSLIIAERNMVETENLNRGKLSIGMPSNIGSFLLFDKIIEFHNIYPNIEVTIITGSTHKLLDLLESHEVDFVIDTSPVSVDSKDTKIKKIKTVNYAFIINKNSQFKYNDIKTLKDLEKYPLIIPIPNTENRKDLDKLLLEKNIKIENIINIHTSEMIISGVKKNLGIGYVIENLVYDDKELVILKLEESLPTVDINIIYNSSYLTKAPLKFIKDYIDLDIKI